MSADHSRNDDPGVTQDLELDRICIEFEAALQAGSTPKIEEILQDRSEPQRSQLLRQLLLLEIEYEGVAEVDELEQRFPGDQSLIRDVCEPKSGVTFRPAGTEPPQVESASHDSTLSGSSLHGRFEPGQRVAGRYRIVSLLGKGGMGEVYRADDLVLGQSVALKFLPEDFANDSKRLEYFFSEVRLARQVSHPNVCRVHDIGEVDGQHFISMEFIDGEDLKTLLKRIGRLPEDKGIEIARQLCSGLAAAHDKGVLHRDLKPANVMVDGNGQVRVTDFGLATLATSEGEGHSFVGTPAYMAPEQLTRGKTSVQSDIYSLGLVLFELFTGKAVRKVDDNSEDTSKPSDLVTSLDSAVEETILRCLEADIGRRPRSVTQVAAALPGNDALAVALAAGRTPSPEMVADAGDVKLGSFAHVAGCLVAIAVLLLYYVLVCDSGKMLSCLYSKQELKSATVLEDDAKEILKQLKLDAPENVFTAFDFTRVESDLAAIRPITSENSLEEARGLLAEGPFRGFRFWYRSSPKPMLADNYWDGAYISLEFNRGRVSRTSPAWVAGMIGLELGPSGKLLRFRAKPGSAPLPSRSEIDWPVLFHEQLTGLDLSKCKEMASPPYLPDDVYTNLRAWEGVWPTTGQPIHVVAASVGDRPTFFEISQRDRTVVELNDSARFSSSLPFFIVGVCIEIIVVWLAWRHYSIGVGDRVGALRLSIFVLVAQMLASMFLATHPGGRLENMLLTMLLADALFRSTRAWMFYLAMEPLIRKQWPEILISWTRVMQGRIQDPRVGRDLLIGTLLGTLGTFPYHTNAWLGGSVFPLLPIDPGWISSLSGLGSFAGEIFADLMLSTGAGIFFTVLLVFLAVMAKKKWLANVLFVIVITVILGFGFGLPGGVSSWIAVVGFTSIVYVVATGRFGLLAIVTAVFCVNLNELPITGDSSHPYYEHGLVGVFLLFAIAGYGAYIWLGNKLPGTQHG